MPQNLIGYNKNYFTDIKINNEILFDDYEITQDSSGNLDINNNGVNLIEINSNYK